LKLKQGEQNAHEIRGPVTPCNVKQRRAYSCEWRANEEEIQAHTHLLSCLLVHGQVPDILIRTDFRGAVSHLIHGRPVLGSLILPLGAAVHAGDAPAHLAAAPLLEALLVEVLPACRLAPHDLLARLHVEDADRALAVDGLAHDLGGGRSGLVLAEIWGAGDRRVGEDLLQLLGHEGQLVLQIERGLEDDDESIYVG
jgi:hypothetical protein